MFILTAVSKKHICARSNPTPGLSEIRDGEDLWQCSWLEIRQNAFLRSTIPQKQFIIIIIIIIIIILNILQLDDRSDSFLFITFGNCLKLLVGGLDFYQYKKDDQLVSLVIYRCFDLNKKWHQDSLIHPS